VDGSVLFASVLRQIGIEPILVLVPGHMFMGFYLDPECTKPEFLETTMMGSIQSAEKERGDDSATQSSSGRKSRQIKGILEPAVTGGGANQSSLDSFLAAVKTARKEAQENFGDGERVGKISAYRGNTVRKGKANCQLLPVAKAREMGVMPIGYQP
jgi:hypothetical protein